MLTSPTITRAQGFSLVELSVVLVIVGLLVSSFISGFATYQENRLIQEARNDLQSIHEALIGYAIQNRRLPCAVDPAAFNDGQEDSDGAGGCDVPAGFLPFRDLGVPGANRDPWGRPYGYAVDPNFVGAPPAFAINGLGVIEIHDRGGFAFGACNAPCVELSNNVVAVVYSLGANGCTGFSVHEQENFDAGGAICAALLGVAPAPSGTDDRIFISAPFSNAPANRFDDQIVWLPSGVLVNRMIQAGQLP